MASDILTDAAAAEIEQRANAATKGPWIVAMDGFWVFRYVAGEHYKQIGAVAWDNAGRTPQAKADATFWAAARTDIPALLADRRARIAELAAVTAERDAAVERMQAIEAAARKVTAHGWWIPNGADNFDYMSDVKGVIGTDWNELKAALTPPTTTEPRP